MDFNRVKAKCEQELINSKRFNEQFLLELADSKYKVSDEFTHRLMPYSHIVKEVNHAMPNWLNMASAQFIMHRVFRKSGLISRLFKDNDLENMSKEFSGYIEHQKSYPWRFSFCTVLRSEAPDFYMMQDAFSHEEFILYSPSITRTLQNGPIELWFNLISFNGECWQTYGPMIDIRSFDRKDIIFYAKHLNYQISDGNDVSNDIENNPVPYQLLIYGSHLPKAYHKEFKIVQLQSRFQIKNFKKDSFLELFNIKYKEGLYQLALKSNWGKSIHFGIAYYDESSMEMSMTALTEKAFQELYRAMKMCGISEASDLAQIHVSPQMWDTAQRIFKNVEEINPWERHFNKEVTPDVQHQLDQMNVFMNKLLPFINRDEHPNLTELASECGIDLLKAKVMYQEVLKMIKSDIR